MVGPTFGCLLGQQFQILKKGDRFWYENNIPPSALTKGEKTGLEKVGGVTFFVSFLPDHTHFGSSRDNDGDASFPLLFFHTFNGDLEKIRKCFLFIFGRKKRIKEGRRGRAPVIKVPSFFLLPCDTISVSLLFPSLGLILSTPLPAV